MGSGIRVEYTGLKLSPFNSEDCRLLTRALAHTLGLAISVNEAGYLLQDGTPAYPRILDV